MNYEHRGCARHGLGQRNMKKILFLLLSISLVIVSCKQSPQSKAYEEPVSTQKNRTDSIVFMGIQLGIPCISVEATIDSSNLITKKELPEGFGRYMGASNNSLFDNPEEKIISTFFTQIIDKKNESHDGWGIIKSDSDIITTIQVIIPYCDDVLDVYNQIQELYVEKYGEPDQSYEGEVKAEMRNTGCYWEFPNSQRITLNICKYSGRGGYEGGIDWASKFKGFERVEIAYQDMKAIWRQMQKEEKAKEARQQEERERIDANRKARESQQL